ncbi:MAG: helix-turn-helix domain-containing protein [Candidatus Azobacteroides sp.]|nr:helix-turn-helix domain-containing protein [Candidatus Azobacteroides sp.]
MEIKTKIGQRMKFLREQASMSQKDLAYSADLDRSYIASVESGCRNISIVNIEKIANALNVPLKELFNATEFDFTSGSSK